MEISQKKYDRTALREIRMKRCLLRHGQMGGGESGGSNEFFCDEFFPPVGLNLLSTHRRFQIYPIFGAQYFFWLRK